MPRIVKRCTPLNLRLLSRDQPLRCAMCRNFVRQTLSRGLGMFARKVLYFVSTVIAFALIAGTTVLCLAADNTMQLY